MVVTLAVGDVKEVQTLLVSSVYFSVDFSAGNQATFPWICDNDLSTSLTASYGLANVS